MESKAPINLRVVRFELDVRWLTAEECSGSRKARKPVKAAKAENAVPALMAAPRESVKKAIPPPPLAGRTKTTKELIEALLRDIYGTRACDGALIRTMSSASENSYGSSDRGGCNEEYSRQQLEKLDGLELQTLAKVVSSRLVRASGRLQRALRTRERLRRARRRLHAALTLLLRHIGVRGASGPAPAEGGAAQWAHAMRLVARLPAGIPPHYRKKVWVTLAEQHLTTRGIAWAAAERACFNAAASPDDTELGAQIVKDLHRTGCSLFCGTEGRENQAMLRRVLLAYARWNKEVGYCQGFNMLAAIILEVTESSESDALKVMIYLVEAVLPEGYFADDLRGLSADMAAFRDLLRLRLPKLANHLDKLQGAGDGACYEPPLPDVFTMQWFLTLYATWLPRAALLRVWDLVLLDGSEVLLLTALAIWDSMQDRILSARSADEFYSAMGAAGGGALDPEALVARVVALAPASELPRLRNHHRYEVAPFASTMQNAAKKGLRLFYSEDEGDSGDEAYKMALAAPYALPVPEGRASDRLSLDIGALRRQYERLRERQRQARVILAAACARHAAVGVPTAPNPLSMNHLLLGKSAIVSSRGRRLGPPPGAIPPSRANKKHSGKNNTNTNPETETISWKEEHRKKTISRRDSIKWKDLKPNDVNAVNKSKRKGSDEIDELGDGTIVSELEAKEMMSTLRSRTKSESSSYSDCSGSSTSTSLCDDSNRLSDLESEPPSTTDNANEAKKEKPPPDGPNKSLQNNKEGEDAVQKIIDSSIGGIFLSEEPQNKEVVETEPQSQSSDSLKCYLNEFQKMMSKASSLEPNIPLDVDKLALGKIKTKSPFGDFEFKSIEGLVKSKDVLDKTINSKSDILSPKFGDKLKSESDLSGLLVAGGAATFLELSPIDTSALDYKSRYRPDYDLQLNVSPNYAEQPFVSSFRADKSMDIIEKFKMSPNFVPDIDLSDKDFPDMDRFLSRCEEAEISDDEPPIILKIDKYFEHSPEFFGARKSGTYISSDEDEDSKSNKHKKRLSRPPKKPDTLLLVSNLNENLKQDSHYPNGTAPPLYETNSSMQIYCDTFDTELPNDIDIELLNEIVPRMTAEQRAVEDNKRVAAEDYIQFDTYPESLPRKPIKDINELGTHFGRRNSEKALLIIQENSKILNRILTKQNSGGDANATVTTVASLKSKEDSITINKPFEITTFRESDGNDIMNSKKRNLEDDAIRTKNAYTANTTIKSDSRDLEDVTSALLNKYKISTPPIKPVERNKDDIYGWENKGFAVKQRLRDPVDDESIFTRNIQATSPKSDKYDINIEDQKSNSIIPNETRYSKILENEFPFISKFDKTNENLLENAKNVSVDSSLSLVSPTPWVPNPSTLYNMSDPTYDFSLSNTSGRSKYIDTDYQRTSEHGTKLTEAASKLDSSQLSDFAFVVTSSVSFSYEPSADDASPTAGKSNSSDTLCQITSLDQISTPISPKTFSSQTVQKELTLSSCSIGRERDFSDNLRLSSEDTSNAITSLLETDSWPATSPSSRSAARSSPHSPDRAFNPFPPRAPRFPKEIAIRLGMYSRDPLKSPSK